ncbi:MAG: cell surface protein SprA [Saprospirales bacterium]|nr:MAG: cell surface protein SprA [Saprospirales bacterium]
MQKFILSVFTAVFFTISGPLIFSDHTLSANILEDPYVSILEELFEEEQPDSLRDRSGDFLRSGRNPFDLRDPAIIEQEVEYDPVTNRYYLLERIGDDYFRSPTYMTFQEYMEWRSRREERAYFANLAGIADPYGEVEGLTDPILEIDIDQNLIDRLFGGSEVDIQPQGHIDVLLGARFQNIQNPILPVRQQRQGIFDFNMDIQMNVTGQIGEKLSLSTNYNTRPTFDFENQLNIKFDSEAFDEDDIIKNIEAGNVSLPLRSSLIEGSQSLFGIKTELQFGHLRLTAIASQQRARRENIQIQGGSQIQEFEVRADEYDANRHFFLSHYNRSIFEDALSALPYINSLFRLERVEVWVTNIGNEYEDLRQIVAISDLGEYDNFSAQRIQDEFGLPAIPPDLRPLDGEGALPDNSANRIYSQLLNDGDAVRDLRSVVNVLQGPPYNFSAGSQFEQRRARKLPTNRYNVIPELGVIQLDVALRPDEVLAVAYEYTYNGRPYKVGEFASDIPAFEGDTSSASSQVLFLKMLKSSSQSVSEPMWDLMMKNVYSIGAFQASEEDFRFDIFYDDPAGGQKRFLPEPGFTRPLLEVFNLDNLNYFGDPVPDGFFDFIPGITINTQTGKVMFPVLEPFGSSLSRLLDDEDIFEKYEYQLLYDTTITVAREFQERNRFVMRGTYRSSVTSDISLGAINVPRGSVTVRAGGAVLQEDIDYVVDYQIGRVRIINDSYLASGTPINVSFEDNSMFSFQTRSMVGLRADYTISRTMSVGGTYMHLWEKPFTEKVNFGDDPINNRVFGLDFNYSNEAPWLTRAVDAIPGLSTREQSQIDFYIEGAALRPGHSKAINVGDDEGGVVYIDDFEGSASRIDLRVPVNSWVISSIPEGTDKFPESQLIDADVTGANRALINWYRIERIIAGSQNDPYTRTVGQQEIFRNRPNLPTLFDFRTFDISYYPDERGPYNFDRPEGIPGYSAGLTPEGKLQDPQSRWGGLMRALPTNDFELTNIEYVEFWMLNPFIGTEERPIQEGGYMHINLGNVSEDILKDGLQFFENGLPVPGDVIPTDTTAWGRVPTVPPVVYAFANDPEARALQDVGLDGLDSLGEITVFRDYYESIIGSPILTNEAKARIVADLSNDDYRFFDDPSFSDEDGVFERYRRWNNPEGNSPISQAGQRISNAYTNFPDSEDINRDGSMNRTEAYFDYQIPIKHDGNNALQWNDFITDTVVNPNNQIWYRFKVPIKQYDRRVGGIQDFRAIKFMRIYMTGFEQPVTLRFASLDLTRNQWRRVTRPIDTGISDELEGNNEFEISVVNIEEHSSRSPFRYIIPPGIQRERNYQSTFANAFLNEQSLALEICNLEPNRMNAVYKILGEFDMRYYERLKMFVHAETLDNLQDEDLSIVMRLGSDYVNNYYEYEIPMVFSRFESGVPYDRIVWPQENEFDFPLELLKEVKLNRNQAGVPINSVYSEPDPENTNNTVRVVGNPNTGQVKSIFIGVRNNSGNQNFCAEVWVNELRLTGLNEQGGYAALARLNLKLADFGNISVSGNYSSVGWGSLEQRVQQRSKEAILQYDIAGDFELGKFLPENSNIDIPFFAQYSSEIRTPQFDPFDMDVELNEKLNLAESRSERDSLREQAIEKTEITSFNFTNVRKRRSGGDTPMPWDIENWTLSYAYTETNRSDPIIERDDNTHHTGTINYRYTIPANYIEPFKNIVGEGRAVRLISDFNFNPLPSTIGFRTTVDRRLNQRRFRFTEDFPVSTSRQFLWSRDHELNWDLTRSLRLNFSARSNSVIDELTDSGFDWRTDEFVGTARSDRRQFVWDNVRDFGRIRDYNHNLTANYKVPIDKLPFMEWISIDARYTTNYTWSAASFQAPFLGNSLYNARGESIRANLNFERLYNSIGYLSRINRSGRAAAPGRAPAQQRDQGRDQTRQPSVAERIIIRPLLLVRRGRFNFNRDYTSFVPGFMDTPSFAGMSSGLGSPGIDYAFGRQPSDVWLVKNATQNGWFSADRRQNQNVSRTFSESWNAELNLEPFRDFRIDLKMDRRFSTNESFLFKNFGDENVPPEAWRDAEFGFGSVSEFGSYSISYLALNTLFKDSNSEIQGMFNTFKSNRSEISGRLNPDGDPHPKDGPDYKEGFGANQEQVLLPSFLAAYTDTDPRSVTLDLFDVKPMPNWTVNYNGLSRLPWFNEVFDRITISHGYSSTLTANSFQSRLSYVEDEFGNSQIPENVDSVSANFYPRISIPQLTISESFVPLIGINIQTKGGIELRFDYKKSRTLALSTIGQNLNETRSTDFTIGFGYVIQDFRFGGQQRPGQRGERRPGDTRGQRPGQQAATRDLRMIFDFSIRDDRTLQHSWGLDINPRDTRGQRAIRIAPAIEYDLTNNLSMRLFMDYFRTVPYTTQSYPITNTQAGVRVRFTLN